MTCRPACLPIGTPSVVTPSVSSEWRACYGGLTGRRGPRSTAPRLEPGQGRRACGRAGMTSRHQLSAPRRRLFPSTKIDGEPWKLHTSASSSVSTKTRSTSTLLPSSSRASCSRSSATRQLGQPPDACKGLWSLDPKVIPASKIRRDNTTGDAGGRGLTASTRTLVAVFSRGVIGASPVVTCMVTWPGAL